MKFHSHYLFVLCLLLAVTGCHKSEPSDPSKNGSTASQDSSGIGEEKADNGTDNIKKYGLLNQTASKLDDFSPSPMVTQSEECPKGAFRTESGVCSCFYGSENEKEGLKRYGKLRPDGSDVLGNSFQCTDMDYDGCSNARLAVCMDIHGCRTLDGRWYEALGRADVTVFRSFYPRFLKDPYNVSDYLGADPAYILGGMDTSLESGPGPAGICVLDRTDGIPLFSDAPDAKDNFACNRQKCPCGDNTCQNGQICKSGKCEWDKQEPLVLNDSNSKFIYYSKDLNGPEYDLVNVYQKLYEACEKSKDPNCTLNIPDDAEGDFGIRHFDTVTCKGGQHYCHGRGNFPMPKPGEDYFCKQVDGLPGYSSKLPMKAWVCGSGDGCACGSSQCPMNAACINGTCYCGKETIPDGYTCAFSISASNDLPVQTLECNQESCKCGNFTCKKGESCEDGRCTCDGNHFSDKNGDAITRNEYICVQPNASSPEHSWICNDPKGCTCGYEDAFCPNGAKCLDGESECYCGDMLIPGKMTGFSCVSDELVCTAASCNCNGEKISQYEKCHPVCGRLGTWDNKKEMCQCNGEAMNAAQYRCVPANGGPKAVCLSEDGCQCGKKQCPYMSLCTKGECVDRMTGKPFPSGFAVKEGMPFCESDGGCTCGKKTCEKDKYCLNGTCFRDPYTKKIGNKVLYYRFEYTDFDADGFEEMGNQAIQRETLLDVLLTDLDGDGGYPICGKEEDLKKHYHKDLYLHESRKGISSFDEEALCRDPRFKDRDLSIADFLHSCGTDDVPEDVAVKYCYMRVNLDTGECGGDLRLEYSGWQGENFKF